WREFHSSPEWAVRFRAVGPASAPIAAGAGSCRNRSAVLLRTGWATLVRIGNQELAAYSQAGSSAGSDCAGSAVYLLGAAGAADDVSRCAASAAGRDTDCRERMHP